MSAEPKLMTKREAALYLGLTSYMIDRLVEAGHLAYRLIDTRRLFMRVDLDECLDHSRVQPGHDQTEAPICAPSKSAASTNSVGAKGVAAARAARARMSA